MLASVHVDKVMKEVCACIECCVVSEKDFELWLTLLADLQVDINALQEVMENVTYCDIEAEGKRNHKHENLLNSSFLSIQICDTLIQTLSNYFNWLNS